MFTNTDITHTLQTIPWFLELKPFQLERLAKVVSIRSIDTGQVLFTEGEREDFLYILLEGQIALDIHVPTRGCVNIFTAEPLDIFGWSSLTPVVRQRTASAHALNPVRVLAFKGEALRELCDEDHDIGYVMMRRVANVAASRLLITRLHMFDIILVKAQYPTQLE